MCGNFSSFTAPSLRCKFHPYSFFFFLRPIFNKVTFFSTTLRTLLFVCLFIYLWPCWVFVSVRGLSLVAASGGHPSSWCTGLSLSWPLLLRSKGSRCAGSVIVAHGPSCSAACGIFPDQSSNPFPLHSRQILNHCATREAPSLFFCLCFLFFLLPYPGIWGVSCLLGSLRSSASVQ